jgi:hypothetical protein
MAAKRVEVAIVGILPAEDHHGFPNRGTTSNTQNVSILRPCIRCAAVQEADQGLLKRASSGLPV